MVLVSNNTNIVSLSFLWLVSTKKNNIDFILLAACTIKSSVCFEERGNYAALQLFIRSKKRLEVQIMNRQSKMMVLNSS